MALRAVYREVRRAAKRLDASPLAAQAHGTHSFDADALRSMMNIKAFLLPEPYSPEAMAYASSSTNGTPWSALVHFGARRALRARFGPDELLSDSLSLLKELGAFEHSIASSAAFRKHAQPADPAAVEAASSDRSILHLRTHAALAAILDGAEADHVEARLEDSLQQLSARAESLANANRDGSTIKHGVSPMVQAVNHVLFVELGLHSMSSVGGVVPLDPATPTLPDDAQHTRFALIHRAFDAPHRGSPLALGLILSEVLGRCIPSLPPPKLIALPLATQPLATWRAAEGLTTLQGDVHYKSVLEAALGSRPPKPELTEGELTATQGAADAPRTRGGAHRILVACVDAPAGSARASVTLLDPSASGARTRLECSDELVARIRRSDPQWDAWAAQNGAGAAPEVDPYRQYSPTAPWEVPASALLDRPGVVKLLLRQLADLYHAAGTPHALRMHHRCAQLLTDMEQQGNSEESQRERSHK